VEELLGNLKLEPDSLLVLHVGLGRLLKLSGLSAEAAVQEIVDCLRCLYEPRAILVPTFTPTFRTTGVFSVNHSRSEVGVFSEMLRHLSTARTPDPLHSLAILTRDPSDFSTLNYEDTFSYEGIYGTVHRSKSYILNIGTDGFMATQLHFLERLCKVPYLNMEKARYTGIVYDRDDRCQKRVQVNRANRVPVHFNRQKLVRLFRKDSLIQEHWLNGIWVSAISTQDMTASLSPRMLTNGFFLVTF
jgi:aminoglycoside N3'-acetyltransferase